MDGRVEPGHDEITPIFVFYKTGGKDPLLHLPTRKMLRFAHHASSRIHRIRDSRACRSRQQRVRDYTQRAA
jgi:hypothetical protein